VWNRKGTTIRINEWKPGPAEAEAMSPPPPFKPLFKLRKFIRGLVLGIALCRILGVPFAPEINQLVHLEPTPLEHPEFGPFGPRQRKREFRGDVVLKVIFCGDSDKVSNKALVSIASLLLLADTDLVELPQYTDMALEHSRQPVNLSSGPVSWSYLTRSITGRMRSIRE
jgi:hypothetical protein